MSLQPGQMLLHYRLAEKIGEGGMGVVWRALDTTLDRDVAIKILPEAFSADSDRVARFEREAKVLASLNHPNIASIHGLHETEHLRFLAMELVKGESLAQRLERGPVALEETLGLAVPIAEALEAAHENGIIHRDLKPANIQVTPDGKVKVLDFGLAKALDVKSSSGDPANSPTVTSDGTMAGVILGTAAYMSPEQARGKPVDKRTDIWAFGCVLYECLAGRPAYHGETITDVLSAILRAEPEWAALPHNTPHRVRDLLERCLEKSQRVRLRDLGDARIELERSLAGREWTAGGLEQGSAVASAQRAWWRNTSMLAAGILIGVAAVVVGTFIYPWSASRDALRLSFQVPTTQKFVTDNYLAVTPDGGTVAYPAHEKGPTGEDWVRRLYLRHLDDYETIAIEGSLGVVGHPAFSPDGREIAWIAPLATNPKQHVLTGPIDLSAPPRVIAEWPESPTLGFPSLVWLPNGDIVGVTGVPKSTEIPLTLVRFPSDGRPPEAPVQLIGVDLDDFQMLRSVLPDHRTVLAQAWRYGKSDGQTVAVAIDTQSGETRIVAEDATSPAWSATGHLLFSRRDVLMAVSFDSERVETIGGPSALLQGIGDFALSSTGTLVYRRWKLGGTARRLALFDTENRMEDWTDDRRLLYEVVAAPDGRRIAVRLADVAAWTWQIWVSGIDDPHLRPLATEDCMSPVWTPDGEQLVYRCAERDRGDGVYVSNLATGDEPRLVLESEMPGEFFEPTSVSSDGTRVLVNHAANGMWSSELAPLVTGGSGSPSLRVIVPEQSDRPDARFSPDGRWIAFVSSRAGKPDIVVRSVDEQGRLGPEIVVSSHGGTDVIWSKEEGPRQKLLYRGPRGHLMEVSIEDHGLLSSGPRPALDLVEHGILKVDTMPGGGYLAILLGEDEQSNIVNVVLAFDDEIRRRASDRQ